jgi:hypothetical protein
MKLRFGRPPCSRMIEVMVLLYGIYLVKTAAGLNLSNRYTASWILKVPLEPLWNNKTTVCAEFQTLCSVRSAIQHSIQNRVNHLKRLG